MTNEPLEFIDPVALKAKMDGGTAVIVVDARNPDEFAGGHIPGACNVPVSDMPSELDQIASAKNSLVVTTCGSSGRGEKAAQVMAESGFAHVAVLRGGLAAWRQAGLPVEGEGAAQDD